MRIFALALLALTLAFPAQAEVTNTAANGFTVKHQQEINAPAAEVWQNLIAPARWWNGDHSWSGNAENLYLVAQAGGCFCELLKTKSDDNIKSSNGSVRHMRVLFVQNGKAIRMSGALGPLQGEAVVGTLTIELKDLGETTAARFTYKVGGYMEFPIDEIGPAVDAMIGEQLTRLAALFAEAEVQSDVSPDPEASSDDEEASEETAN